MMWHVVFAEHGELAQSRAARSRDSAIHVACELLDQSYDVRRIIEPNGSFIERLARISHSREPAAADWRHLLAGVAIICGSR
jgi:hypothetical protein